jgi:hypothetical protein
VVAVVVAMAPVAVATAPVVVAVARVVAVLAVAQAPRLQAAAITSPRRVLRVAARLAPVAVVPAARVLAAVRVPAAQALAAVRVVAADRSRSDACSPRIQEAKSPLPPARERAFFVSTFILL